MKGNTIMIVTLRKSPGWALVCLSLASLLCGCRGPTRSSETPRGSTEKIASPTTEPTTEPPAQAGDKSPAGPIILQRQDGERIEFGALKGKVLLVSFIYTRCPSPTMCPLVTRKFVRVQEETAEIADHTLLLLVTLDPEYDRPRVLGEYGKLNHADPSNLWLLTGERSQLERLWKLFGVYRKEEKPGVLAHTMDAFLIDQHGNMSHVFPGSFWEVDVVADAIQALVEEKEQEGESRER